MDDSAKLNAFFRELQNAEKGLLLLDYDGTLAPFVEDRLKAVPAPGIRERLNSILKLENTRTVFVSGRPCDELLSLAGLDHPVEVWGCHGREFHDLAGNTTLHGVTPEQQRRLQENYEKVVEFLPQEKLEVKTGCLAFHWRGVPEDELKQMLARFEEDWQRVAEEEGLLFLRFDGGIELAVPGRSKADAVEELVRKHASDGRPVAFLGDDLTDEDGFRALGERGLSVLVRNEPRDTLADVRITMPAGVLEFLDRWAQAATAGKQG